MSYAALPTKNPGDVLTSALWNTYLLGNFDSGVARMLADTTLGASAASVDITSIPQTFASLMIVAYLRGDTVASGVDGLLRFNGDSGANYDWASEFATTAWSFNNAAGGTAISFAVGALAAASATANVFSVHRILIPHYANALNHKQVETGGFIKTGAAAGNQIPMIGGGSWRSAAAINRVTILPGSGNLVSGSRVTIYGLPA